MKTLILVALLLAAHAAPAPAETCTGRVTIDAVKNELAGGRIVYVGECMFLPPALPKQILRSCPAGSYCRVEGVSYGEGEVGSEIAAVGSVTRIDPYQQGVRDYREGRCFRAQPYSANTEEGKLWIKGYHAHQTTKISRRNDEHCFLGRDR